MKTENLSTLKIHKLTQEQYNKEKAAGRIEENALYLTPDTGSDSDADSDCGIYVGPGEMPEDCNVQIDPDGDSFTLEELRGEKGESGVYVGSGDMPEDYNVQIDPDGDTFTFDELKGNDGKSAYEYAKDGGYTGTEEEFAQKLATEVTPEQIGALPLTGGTINGPLYIVKGKGVPSDNAGGLVIEHASTSGGTPQAFITFATPGATEDTKRAIAVGSFHEVSGLGYQDLSSHTVYKVFTSKEGIVAQYIIGGILGGPVQAHPQSQADLSGHLRNLSLYPDSNPGTPQVNGEIMWIYG